MRKAKYAKHDFDESLLPSTRIRQFFDIFKREWRTLFLIGLLILLFFLPLFVSHFIEWIVNYTYVQALVASEASNEQIIAIEHTIKIIYCASMIIIYPIVSIGLAGCSRIIQNLVYGEGILFKSDFANGIKNNGKQFAIISIIAAVINFIVQFINISFDHDSTLFAQIFKGLSTGVYYLIFLPVVLFALSQSVTYRMKIGTLFSNAFKLTVSKIIFAIVFAIILYSLTFIEKIKNIAFIIGVQALVIILLAPIFYLCWHLFSVSIFDKYINKENYKEIYRKGLCPNVMDSED